MLSFVPKLQFCSHCKNCFYKKVSRVKSMCSLFSSIVYLTLDTFTRLATLLEGVNNKFLFEICEKVKNIKIWWKKCEVGDKNSLKSEVRCQGTRFRRKKCQKGSCLRLKQRFSIANIYQRSLGSNSGNLTQKVPLRGCVIW